MKVFVILLVVTFLAEESLSGGVTKTITDEELIIHGQASDILAKFSSDILKNLQDLSDEYNEIARKRDDEDFKMLTGRGLKSKDNLKVAASQKLDDAFNDFIEDIANISNIDIDTVWAIVNDSADSTQATERIREFVKTAQLVYESANGVVTGKSDEFVIHVMNKNKAESVNFNLSGC